MKAVGYACDVCSTFEQGDASKPPSHWFSVKRVDQNEEQDVCSSACLCKLGKQLAALEVEAQQLDCPTCTRSFRSKQGLGSHITKSHSK